MDMIEIKILHNYDSTNLKSRMGEIGAWLKDHGLEKVGDWEFSFIRENDQTYYLIKIQPKFKEVATMLALRWL